MNNNIKAFQSQIIDLGDWLGGANPFPSRDPVDEAICATGTDQLILIGQNVVIVALVVIVIVAVVFMIFAGLKLIRSQGKQDEIEQGNNAFVNILLGLIFMFTVLFIVNLVFGQFAPDPSIILC